MTAAGGLPSDLLEKLILGQLPPDEIDRLCREFADDVRVAELAEQLDGDPLLDTLRTQQTPSEDPRVEKLIGRLLRSVPSAFTPPADEAPTAPADGEPLPERDATLPDGFDQFRVLGVLGEGGMGTVYLAEDARLGRRVALKTMRRDLAASPAAKERFFREARSAASIEHENVIPIHHVGEADGVPYLAMPLLKGEPLDRRLKRAGGPLPVAEVLAVGREVAAGLAAAHDRGLVHRDVKPGNVWLEDRGPSRPPRAKVLDFGLARSAADDARLTKDGAVIGTPAYMAPEQARGEKVDTRADLFSLGCVLYHLATGRQPFAGEDTLAVLSNLALHTPPPAAELNPAVPAGLSALIGRLLAKNPAARPASAHEVARELADLEVQAIDPTRDRPDVVGSGSGGPLPDGRGASGRGRRWVLIAAGLAGLAALVVAGVIIIRDKSGKEVARVTVPPDGSYEYQPDAGEKPTAAGTPEPAEAGKLPPPVAIKPAPLPPLQGGEPLSPVALAQRPAPIKGVRSWTLETARPRGVVFAAVYSPDGKYLACAGRDGVHLLDAGTYRVVQVLSGALRFDGVPAVAWSPAGRLLACAAEGRTVLVWNAPAGRLLRSFTAGDSVTGLAWSADGRTLTVATYSRGLELRDAESGRELVKEEKADCITVLARSPDGKMLATSGAGMGKVQLWNAASLKPLRTLPLPYTPRHVAWSADGGRLFTTSNVSDKEGTDCWDPATGKRLWPDPVKVPGQFTMAVSPDGTTLALGGNNGATLLLCDARTGEVKRRFPAPSCDNDRMSLSWSPDGKTLAFCNGTSEVTVWDAVSGELVKSLEGLRGAGRPAWSADGRVIAFPGGSGGTTLLYAPAGGTKPATVPRYFWAEFSPDGRTLIAQGKVFDYPTLTPRAFTVPWEAARGIPAWSPDGRTVAVRVSTPKPGVYLTDAFTGKQGVFIDAEEVADVWAWSPSGRYLARAARRLGVEVWDAATGARVRRIDQYKADIDPGAIAWSPDEKVLAVPVFGEGSQWVIRLWDPSTGELLDTLRGHRGSVTGLYWSSDGKTLTSGAADGIRDWSVATGTLLRHRPWPLGRPSPDRRFGADTHLNTLRVWDLEIGQRRLTLMSLQEDRWVAISPEGHYASKGRVERDLLYVAQLEDGSQETLTPEEFAKRFGWTNDPAKVGLDAAK